MNTEHKRVLLVDDEPLVLELFENTLSSAGYDVFTAASAAEAVKLLQRAFVDILICDVMLEGLDGFEIMKIAREHLPTVDVTLITGAPSYSDRLRAEEFGARYISKPVGLDTLLNSLQ